MMKKLIIILFGLIFITSCQITERVNISEDGSIDYGTEFDFTEMTGFIFPENKKDSLRAIGEYPIDTLMNIDELADFSKFNKDTLTSAQKDYIKSMEKMKIRMLVNDDKGILGLNFKEKSVDAFNNYLKEIDEAVTKLVEEDPTAAENIGMINTFQSGEFKYDGKLFERVGGNISNFFNDKSGGNINNQMMSMFSYKLEYTFPKKIKSTTLEEATFSLDGKTLTTEVKVSDLVENSEKGNFKVVLED